MLLAIRKRSVEVCRTRTLCGQIGDLDEPIIEKVINHVGPKEKQVFVHIATGAFWNECQ